MKDKRKKSREKLVSKGNIKDTSIKDLSDNDLIMLIENYDCSVVLDIKLAKDKLYRIAYELERTVALSDYKNLLMQEMIERSRIKKGYYERIKIN
jgi:uncharacterized protein YaiI (UPF0178 family)